MINKIIKIAVVLIIILLIMAFVVRAFWGSTNSLSYKIFSVEADGYYFHKLLGIVPSFYQNRYLETVLDSYDNKKVLNVIDQKGSSHSNFIMLKLDNEIKFLKGYPFKLVDVNDETIESKGWGKHVSLLINLETFNYYLKTKHLTSREEIINKYFYFLSNPVDKHSYRILRDSSDVTSLLIEKPAVNKDFLKETGYVLLEIKEIDFKHPEGTALCWFHNKGVVKFIFVFNDDNSLQSVESEIVGLLGNEEPSI